MTKKLNEEGNYSDMTVGELRKALEGLEDSMPVYIRTCFNPVGNICAMGDADVSYMRVWGAKEPIVIIEPAYIDYLICKRTKAARLDKIEKS